MGSLGTEGPQRGWGTATLVAGGTARAARNAFPGGRLGRSAERGTVGGFKRGGKQEGKEQVPGLCASLSDLASSQGGAWPGFSPREALSTGRCQQQRHPRPQGILFLAYTSSLHPNISESLPSALPSDYPTPLSQSAAFAKPAHICFNPFFQEASEPHWAECRSPSSKRAGCGMDDLRHEK